jgi:hypothetical protein
VNSRQHTRNGQDLAIVVGSADLQTTSETDLLEGKWPEGLDIVILPGIGAEPRSEDAIAPAAQSLVDEPKLPATRQVMYVAMATMYACEGLPGTELAMWRHLHRDRAVVRPNRSGP